MRIPSIDPRRGPLTAAQASQLNAFLATLSPEQLPWLLGFFAGFEQAQADAESAGRTATLVPVPPPEAPERRRLTVLYASQTGNSAKIAGQVAAAAAAAGIPAAASSVGDYPTTRLRDETDLVFICSTQGEGDPPDAAVEFRRFLFGKRAPRLAGLRFAVLALGDYSYANFCQAGAEFDRRLAELGAERVLERVDCDVEFEAPAAAWQGRVLEAWRDLGEGPSTGAHRPAASPASLAIARPTVLSVVEPAAIPDKAHPFAAPVLERITLNGRGSAKATVHFELSLTGSGIVYEPGDSLGVLPRNSESYVRELLAAARLPEDAPVTVDGQGWPLREALLETFEVTAITRPFLRAYVEVSGHAELASLLETERAEALRAYVHGREILDVLLAFPCDGLSAQAFVGMLRRLQPRLYSIASSPRAHEDEAHLLVGLTHYESHGRVREGVCSGYLCSRRGEDEPVRVYVSPNPAFRLPEDPEARVIMIGPGTGVAPFRAFIEERAARGGRGRNWLFFGDQHFATDFLYQLEWQRWYKSGVLSRLDLAFSRDQPEKIYVQQRMLENARDLYAWLQAGAHLYVCGDAGTMAVGVHETLIAIVARQGGKTREDAVEYVEGLQAGKRYVRDVY